MRESIVALQQCPALAIHSLSRGVHLRRRYEEEKLRQIAEEEQRILKQVENQSA